MQHKESSAAPAQAPADTVQNQTTGAAAPGIAERTLDQLTEMAALSWSVSANYAQQVKLTGQLAKAEWQLSGRSAVLAVVLALCFGAGLIVLWIGVLLLLGYLLMQFTASVALTASALMLLQLLTVMWCWRSLHYALSQIGFVQTWLQLQRLFEQAPVKTSAGDPDANK